MQSIQSIFEDFETRMRVLDQAMEIYPSQLIYESLLTIQWLRVSPTL